MNEQRLFLFAQCKRQLCPCRVRSFRFRGVFDYVKRYLKFVIILHLYCGRDDATQNVSAPIIKWLDTNKIVVHIIRAILASKKVRPYSVFNSPAFRFYDEIFNF